MPRFIVALSAFFTGTSRALGLALVCPVRVSLWYIGPPLSVAHLYRHAIRAVGRS